MARPKKVKVVEAPKEGVEDSNIEKIVEDYHKELDEVVIEVKEPEIIAVIKPVEKKEPKLVGYHPITGEEVWL